MAMTGVGDHNNDDDAIPGGESKYNTTKSNQEHNYAQQINDGFETFDEPSFGSQQNIPLTQEKGKKRKRVTEKCGVAAALVQNLGSIADTVTNRNIRDKSGYSTEEVMQLIEELPEVTNDDELLVHAAVCRYHN